MAGYSGTPLIKKLGIREPMSVQFVNPPVGHRKTLGRLPAGVTICKRSHSNLDFLQGFVTQPGELEKLLARACRYLARDGMLWVSWPKKASGVPTNVAEADVRKAGLAAGPVDVKICVVDDTWSGLKDR